ncbi:hypothetical protein M9H77_06522 [Catharanthus roseus]|uniref:Uncharacterized protein n=1 Tax=Catharanthus roseus TaxID=4058 RepID=A0ACC0BSL5_CATRO|nr:hypothetical protein M9H77_06522 [Catharanthus roseus]
MVKTKNANIGKGKNLEEGGSSGGRGKGQRVPFGARALERFISVKEAANFEKVDLNDMQGMDAIPNLFNATGWTPLLTVNELFYPEMIYEFYANLHKGIVERVENIAHQWMLSRIGGRNIAFDDRLLNTILETPQDGMRFYTKNKKWFDPNLYSERRFEETFMHGEVLKRHDDRNVNKLDAYGRLLHHMIANIIIPNVGHKSSITNMHSFVMLALHEHRRMNFGFMAIEHMLAAQSSSTKCLPYGCFITKIFQHFVINLVGVGDHIGSGKIYNQNTFKRMEFERNDEGLLIRGGQQGSDDDDDEEDNGDEEEGNEPKSMDEKDTNEEEIRRQMISRKRQERTEEGQSSVDTTQIMDRIAAITKEAYLKSQGYTLRRKDLGDQGKIKEKRSSH